MKYIVTEIQTFPESGVSTPSYAYDNQQAAEAKFHAILAAAAQSALPVHAAILFSDEGFPLRHECYKHEASAPSEGGEGGEA